MVLTSWGGSPLSVKTTSRTGGVTDATVSAVAVTCALSFTVTDTVKFPSWLGVHMSEEAFVEVQGGGSPE